MANIALRSFASGELSPSFYGASDRALYAAGLRTCRNAAVMRTGGVQNRAGFQYIASTKNDGVARLIPCVFTDDRNYLLEFGDGYLRIWQGGAPVQAVIFGGWLIATAYTAGLAVTNGGDTYYCYADHTAAAGNEPGVGANWQDFWTLLPDGQIEIPTPYQDTELDALRVAMLPGQMVLAHPSYAVRVLTQTAVNNQAWNLATATFTTSAQAPPTSLTASVGGSGGFIYAATAVDAEGNESTLSNTDETNNTATAFANCTVSWTAATNAVSYNVYRTGSGTTFAKIGTTTTTSFVDTDPLPPSFDGPPQAAVDFSTTDNYPSAVAVHQQRLILGATNANPDKMYASVTGQPFNFTTRDPLVDSDMVSWRQVSTRSVTVRSLLAIAERLLSFANVGEFVIAGNEAGILTPGSVNPVQLSFNGANGLEPLPIDDTAIYVQARGNQVRNLVPVNQDGYTGTEISWTANHLLDGHQIDAWAYQEVPHSTIWMVRDDGAMLSLTYFREANIIGWARHDTDGLFESIAVVSEGGEDVVYAVVQRTINSVTRRYIERLTSRVDLDAAMFVDAGVRLTQVAGVSITTTNTLYSLGDNETTADVTASGNAFSASDIGDFIIFNIGGTWVPYQIVGYTSATQVLVAKGGAEGGLTDTTFTRANWVQSPNLTHLRGKALSVVLDGVTVASPNNAGATTTYTATNLANPTNYTDSFGINPSAYFDEIVVGLPYTTDIQTLDIDAAGQTIKQQGLNVGELLAWVQDTERFWAGPKPPTTTGITELEQVTTRDDEGYPLDPGERLTGVVKQVLKASWNNTGRVFLRNVDPTPMTVLAIIPTGYWGGR